MMPIDSRERSMHPSLSPSPPAIYPPHSAAYSSKLNMSSYHAAVQNVTVNDFARFSSELQLNVDSKTNVFDANLGPATPSQLPSFISPTELSHEASSPGFASDASSYNSPYDSEGMAYTDMDMLSAQGAFTHEPSPALTADYEWSSNGQVAPLQHQHSHPHSHSHHQHQPLYEQRQLPSQPSGPYAYAHQHSMPSAHMPTLASHGRYIKHEDTSSADGDDDSDDDSEYLEDRNSGTSAPKTRRRGTPHDKARIICHICNTPFARTFNYNTHMATHDPNRQRPFVCAHAGCDKRFYRQTDLNRHDQSVHVKSKAFKCDWCDKGFPRKDSLDRHRQDGCLQRHKVRAKHPSSNKVHKRRLDSQSPSALRTLSPQFMAPEDALRLASQPQPQPQAQGPHARPGSQGAAAAVYYPDWQPRL